MIKNMCRIVIKISIILSIVFLLFKPLRDLYLILGLLLGAYYSVMKTYIFEGYFENIVSKVKPNSKFYIKTILSQIVNLVILIIAVLVNTNFFIGVTIGVLLLPFVITVSALKKKG